MGHACRCEWDAFLRYFHIFGRVSGGGLSGIKTDRGNYKHRRLRWSLLNAITGTRTRHALPAVLVVSRNAQAPGRQRLR